MFYLLEHSILPANHLLLMTFCTVVFSKFAQQMEMQLQMQIQIRKTKLATSLKTFLYVVQNEFSSAAFKGTHWHRYILHKLSPSLPLKAGQSKLYIEEKILVPVPN
jgi:hypothetical protein